MKYIDADKLIAEIDSILSACTKQTHTGVYNTCHRIKGIITSLQQEPPEGVQGTVHHYGGIAHYVLTNQEQLNARLKQFPNDAEVEIFIEARKEDTK